MRLPWVSIDLPETSVRVNQSILSVTDLDFAYKGANSDIIKGFSLSIVGAQRVAVTGKNGAGKSTLLKLINGELKPLKGLIKLYVNFAYIDKGVVSY